MSINNPSKAVIRDARENEPDILADGIRHYFNCTVAEVDSDGDVWIEGACRGHWLDADDLAKIARAITNGDI